MGVEEVEKILEQIAVAKKISNYKLIPDEDVLRGDGFMGEFYTGSVKDQNTGDVIQTYIKKIPENPNFINGMAFSNEFIFYSNIWPALETFQIEKGVKNKFVNIPEMYSCKCESDDKYIAMENLKVKNFGMVEKSENLKSDMIKEVFKSYGKFHALTFAFKNENLEQYTEMIAPIKDIYVILGMSDQYIETLKTTFLAAHNGLKEIDETAAEKIKPYIDNMKESYQNVMLYDGQYSGLVHGDCWSNNLLFNFEENGKVAGIKFLDFQLCRNSTSIHDLSYFFYSGASKEDFEKLDEYLELYHKSFSDFAIQLGHDGEKLLPIKALKAEWKKHGRLGIFMGIMLWQIKLFNKDKMMEITSNHGKMKSSGRINPTLTSEAFKTNTSNILLHALEYGVL